MYLKFAATLLVGLFGLAAPGITAPAEYETGTLERRIAELCAKLPGEPACRGGTEARCESDDGDVCTCAAGKACEATETSCGCFAIRPAQTDAVPFGSQIVGVISRPRPPQFATTDVKCGADTYTISTGTDGGNCTVNPPGSGGGGGGSCTDGDNGAVVSCDTGCSSSSGAGSCSGP